MPIFTNISTVADLISVGLESINQGNKQETDEYIASKVECVTSTVSSLRLGRLTKLESDIFFGIVYFILIEGKVDISWLQSLLFSTDLFVPKFISQKYLYTQLKLAKIRKEISTPNDVSRHLTEAELLESIDQFDWLKIYDMDLEENDNPLHSRRMLAMPKIIQLQAISLSRILPNTQPELENALLSGSKLRVIVMDPDGYSLKYAAQRIEAATWATDTHQKLILDNLKTLHKMKSIGDTIIKVFDYMPPYSIFIYDYGTPEINFCNVHLYGYKSKSIPSPEINAYEGKNNEVYDFFNQQFAKMWNDASEWPLQSR